MSRYKKRLLYILLPVIAFLLSVSSMEAANEKEQKIDAELMNNILHLSEITKADEFEAQYSKYRKKLLKLNPSPTDYAKLVNQRIMFYYYTEMNTDTIEKYIQTVSSAFRASKDTYQYYFVSCCLSDAYIAQGKINKGIEVGERMMREAKSKKEDIGMALSGHALAMAYMTMQNFDQAINHFRQAIPILKHEKQWNTFAVSSCNYISILIDEKKYNEARKGFLQLDSIANVSIKSKVPILHSYIVLYIKGIIASQLFMKLNDAVSFGKYKSYIEDFYRKNPDYPQESLYLVRMRYAKTTHNYKEMLLYTDKLIEQYKGDVSNLSRMYENKSEAYENLGDYKNALKYIHLCDEAKDSINNQEAKERTAQYSAEYDNMHIELENNRLELLLRNKEITQFRTYVCGAVLSSLIILVFAFYLYKFNRKLTKSNSAKDEFLHHITHEVRTPLNYVLGFADVIAQTTDSQDDSMVEMVGQMHKGSDELMKMFDDIMLLVDIDSGKKKYKKSNINLRSVIHDKIEQLKDQLNPGVDIACNFKNLDEQIHSNESALGYIVLNIIHNAVKHTSKGIIQVSASSGEKGRTVIRVFNPGKPLSAEEQSRLFNRYYKTDTFAQGLGLGLYISRLVASMINATIEANPVITDGAEFIITLNKSC